MTATLSGASAPPTAASTAAAPVQSWPGMSSARMPSWAIGQSPMSITSCERCPRRPATPSGPTANWTRVRQPSPGAAPGAAGSGESPGSGSTVTPRSMPARRRSCWAMTAALSARWAGRDACCQSQPPQPPGRACRHGALTRSGEARRTSTASARANFDVTSVTRATTRSPGNACRTNITGRPSGLATHQPPCATSSMSTSTSWPTEYGLLVLAAGTAALPTVPGRLRSGLPACVFPPDLTGEAAAARRSGWPSPSAADGLTRSRSWPSGPAAGAPEGPGGRPTGR